MRGLPTSGEPTTAVIDPSDELHDAMSTTQSATHSSDRPILAALSVRTALAGTVLGALAALLGYLVTYALLAGDALALIARYAPAYSIARRVFPAHLDAVPVWKAVAWHFYTAAGGGVRFEVLGQQGANTLHFVDYAGGLYAWLWLLPAMLLLVAGAGVALVGGVERPREGAVAGALVTVGYLLATVLASASLAVVVAGFRVGPETGVGMVFGYPIAFGALGGVAVAILGRRAN